MINVITRLAALLLLSGLMAPAQAEQKINVFVSIAPQQHFVEQVGGDRVAVSVMVGPGQSPELYEPTPRQMARLAGADLYFSIGMPFESSWLPEIRKNNPALKIVACCAELARLAGHEHHGHEHGGHDSEHGNSMDPHVWTDPNNVMVIAGLIEAALASHDKANAEAYRQAARAFNKQLQALDRLIAEKTAALKTGS